MSRVYSCTVFLRFLPTVTGDTGCGLGRSDDTDWLGAVRPVLTGFAGLRLCTPFTFVWFTLFTKPLGLLFELDAGERVS